MKQWRWIFLVWILLLFPVCAFGAQGEIPSQMTSTEVCDYIDAHPTQCGGYYFDGFQKELHVVPLLDDSTSLFSFSETTDGYDLVYDAPAVYSKQDLDDAFYYLRQHRDEWDLVSYAVRTKDNGLCISAMEWTDEKKESLKEATGIDQIEFLTATEFSGEGTRQEEMKMEVLRVLSLLALYQEELGIADAYFYQEVGNPVSKEIVILAEDWDEERQEMLEKLTDRIYRCAPWTMHPMADEKGKKSGWKQKRYVRWETRCYFLQYHKESKLTGKNWKDILSIL